MNKIQRIIFTDTFILHGIDSSLLNPILHFHSFKDYRTIGIDKEGSLHTGTNFKIVEKKGQKSYILDGVNLVKYYSETYPVFFSSYSDESLERAAFEYGIPYSRLINDYESLYDLHESYFDVLKDIYEVLEPVLLFLGSNGISTKSLALKEPSAVLQIKEFLKNELK